MLKLGDNSGRVMVFVVSALDAKRRVSDQSRECPRTEVARFFARGPAEHLVQSMQQSQTNGWCDARMDPAIVAPDALHAAHQTNG